MNPQCQPIGAEPKRFLNFENQGHFRELGSRFPGLPPGNNS